MRGGVGCVRRASLRCAGSVSSAARRRAAAALETGGNGTGDGWDVVCVCESSPAGVPSLTEARSTAASDESRTTTNED